MASGMLKGRIGAALLGGVLLAGSIGLATWSLAAEKSAPPSAKSRLEELRKARGKADPKELAPGEYPWASADDVTYIDKMLDEEWKALGHPVSEECSDGEFIRRASLDIIGRIPTLEETHAFMKDKSKDNRVKLINKLLASEEYGKNWANIWRDVMITDGRENGNNQDINPSSLKAWLEKEFNRNTPWNQMVTDLIAANGRWDENGAVNFMIGNLAGQNGSQARATSFLSKLFLCVQTQCTECHDHPWNEWRQDQFHGMRAFFGGTRTRRETRTLDNGQIATDYYVLEERPLSELPDGGGTTFERRNGMVVYANPTYIDGRDIKALARGEKARTHAKKLAALSAPQVTLDFLDEQKSGTNDGPVYLRQQLAKVITAEDNPYFARAIVNRLWYHYFGHSFIKNVDDFDNGQDEPSMPDLLDRIAKDFRQNGHDVKRLTRWICSSRAYSLSSKQKSGKQNDDAVGFFTFMLVKPMTAEQLYDSVMSLTQIHKTSKTADTTRERATFLREFQQTFGTDEIPTTAPKYNGTITQSLMLMNSDLIKRATACAPGSFLHSIVTDKGMSDEEKIDSIYLAGLCRKPTGAERKEIAGLFRGAKSPAEKLWVFEDALWVVLNSSEFILNH